MNPLMDVHGFVFEIEITMASYCFDTIERAVTLSDALVAASSKVSIMNIFKFPTTNIKQIFHVLIYDPLIYSPTVKRETNHDFFDLFFFIKRAFLKLSHPFFLYHLNECVANRCQLFKSYPAIVMYSHFFIEV